VDIMDTVGLPSAITGGLGVVGGAVGVAVAGVVSKEGDGAMEAGAATVIDLECVG
jgi:hypothetical protein